MNSVMGNGRVPPLFSGEETGAADLAECPDYQSSRRWRCRCPQTCRICGAHEHTAIHGAFYGKEPGSAPWGHAFVRRAAGEPIECPASYMQWP